jgi:hypothetical protein
MKRASAYFRTQIDEIARDPVLRAYGAVLAFLQILTAIYWFTSDVERWLVRGAEAVCWPGWENCEAFRAFDKPGVLFAIGAFLFFSLATFALFLVRGRTRAAYFSLLALTFLKLAILTLDFRLRMNHHLMAFWATAVFLFVPRKREAVSLIVALFYFWAGLLKLNSEWLSGSALYGDLWLIHGAAVPWACAYVVGLETVLIWGLFRGGRIAWLVWAQLVVFHTFSFPVVGYYYPVLMYALITIYPFRWLRPAPAVPLRSATGAIAIAVLFSATQLHSKLLPGDTALTGEGRVLSLHMFDAWTTCESRARIHHANSPTVEELDLRLPLPIRLHCDPIVYLSRARRLCREHQARDPGFQDLDLSLRTRRSNETELKTVIDLPGFCARDIHYSYFTPNDWIQR